MKTFLAIALTLFSATAMAQEDEGTANFVNLSCGFTRVLQNSTIGGGIESYVSYGGSKQLTLAYGYQPVKFYRIAFGVGGYTYRAYAGGGLGIGTDPNNITLIRESRVEDRRMFMLTMDNHFILGTGRVRGRFTFGGAVNSPINEKRVTTRRLSNDSTSVITSIESEGPAAAIFSTGVAIECDVYKNVGFDFGCRYAFNSIKELDSSREIVPIRELFFHAGIYYRWGQRSVKS